MVNLQQAKALVVVRGRSMKSNSNGRQRHDESKSRSKKNIKCYNYGKKGHLKKDYRNLKGFSPQKIFTSALDDNNIL